MRNVDTQAKAAKRRERPSETPVRVADVKWLDNALAQVELFTKEHDIDLR
jgi:hypothetical protein